MIENELTTRDVGGVLTISSHDDYIREILRYLGKFLNDVVVESDCGYDFIKYLCNRVERQEGADRLYIENIDSLGKKEKYCFLLPTNVNPFYISSS